MTTETLTGPVGSHLTIRHVGAAAIGQWLARGAADLRAAPLPALFWGLLFVVVGHLLTGWLADRALTTVALIGGFLLVGPLLAAAFYDVSRRLENGERAGLGVELRAWSGNIANIVAFSGLVLIMMAAWVMISGILASLFLETSRSLMVGEAATLGELVGGIMDSPGGLAFAVAYLAAGAAVAVLLFAIGVVALPLMVHRHVDIATAIVTSLRTVRANPGPMALWAVTIVAITLVGMAPWFLLLIIAMPLLGHATWHAYRDLVAED
ncbi:MAG: DUF2189 domain-containing protein [Pseudomonadota bacterium]